METHDYHPENSAQWGAWRAELAAERAAMPRMTATVTKARVDGIDSEAWPTVAPLFEAAGSDTEISLNLTHPAWLGMCRWFPRAVGWVVMWGLLPRVRGRDMRGADLTGANLYGADLTRANLTRADLTRANLTRADLTRADLTGANLYGANLTRADLTRADLTGADLKRADLTRADLTGADLTGADLTRAKEDLYAIFAIVPAEVPAVLVALERGHVDGSVYQSDCGYGCLIGTIAIARGVEHDQIPNLMPNPDRPAEKWFMAIRPGDTPQNHPIAKITAGWIGEWVEAHAQQVAQP